MRGTISDKLIEAALRTRDAEPWLLFEDSDMFAFKASTGETVYVAVLGASRETYAVCAYIGAEGFQSALDMTAFEPGSQADIIDLGMRLNVVKCDYDNASMIPDESKRRMQNYKKRYNPKMRRSHGWPAFVRMRPYIPQEENMSDADALILTEALEAATFAIGSEAFRKLITSLPMQREYPEADKAKEIPMLTRNAEAGYDISTTMTPLGMTMEPPKPKFKNDMLAFRLKNTMKSGSAQARLILIPLSAPDKQNRPVYIGMFLTCNPENGYVDIIRVDDYPYDVNNVLAPYAHKLLEYDPCPATITSTDAKTRAMLEDFCSQCGLGLEEPEEPEEEFESICDNAFLNLEDFLSPD